MSLIGWLFRTTSTGNDEKRNANTTPVSGVACHEDIVYGKDPQWNVLNVYYPEGTYAPLPTIVSIHGGGYVYGTKEIYHHYCADLARRGFTVVNFTYRLAPAHKFPAPLEDTNMVLQWLVENAAAYCMDPGRVFLVGDSAGAQLASQYAAIVTNPEYAKHFEFSVPPVCIRAVGLNCGMYEVADVKKTFMKGLYRDYVSRKTPDSDPRLQVLANVTGSFPPAHITTACNDFLKRNAKPMCELLASRGVEAKVKCYGTPEQKHIAHVFHVDIRNPEATQCNDEQCAFFRKHLDIGHGATGEDNK